MDWFKRLLGQQKPQPPQPRPTPRIPAHVIAEYLASNIARNIPGIAQTVDAYNRINNEQARNPEFARQVEQRSRQLTDLANKLPGLVGQTRPSAGGLPIGPTLQQAATYQTKNPVANAALAIPQYYANAPIAAAKVPGNLARYNEQLLSQGRPRPAQPTQVVSGIGETLGNAFNALAPFAGVGSVKQVTAKTVAAKGIGKRTLAASGQGALHAAPYGVVHGFTAGLQQPAENVGQQFKQAGKRALTEGLASAGAGGVLGAGTVAAPAVVKGALPKGKTIPGTAVPTQKPGFLTDFDNAINAGDKAKATQVVAKLPKDNPYKEPLTNILKVTSSEKVRGFPKRLATNPNTPAPVAEAAASNTYTPLTNKEVLTRVRKSIKADPQKALSYARSGKDTDANATAMVLIEDYLKKGKYEDANQLIKEVSPRFTEQGQQVQILSVYGRLTPTGAVKFTQNLLDKVNANRAANRKITLTPEATKEISKLAEGVQKMPEGREKTVAIAKLLDKMAAQVPASLGQKISALQTMAQLLNPKTAIRNTVGNTGFLAADDASMVTATGFDKLIAKFNGKRTQTLPDVGLQVKGAKEGFKLGLEDALEGIDTAGRGTQFDLPSRTFRKGFLDKAEKALNIELRATDRAAYNATYLESLDNQMRAARLNGSKITKPTPEMMQVAGEEGLYRTFQDKSLIARYLSGSKKLLNFNRSFGVGDLVLKYPKTPGNLVAKGLDYSPVGFAKAIFQAVRSTNSAQGFNQRQFVQSLGRATNGTGLIAGGYALAKAGVLTGKPDSDSDIGATRRATGNSPFNLNISALKRLANGEDTKPRNGDKLVSYDWFQPLAIQIGMGANIALNRGKPAEQQVAGLFDTALEGLQAGVDTITDQPVIRQYSDFQKTAGNPNLGGISRALANAALGAPASFTPGLLNQIAQYTDKDAEGNIPSRNTYDPSVVQEGINKVKTRIPGLRQTLNPRVDVLGKEQIAVENGNIFNTFFNPAFLRTYVESPSAQLALDIYERSGYTNQAPRVADKTQKINGENLKLSADQLERFQRYTGTRVQQTFDRLGGDPEFKALPDKEKADRLGQVLSDIAAAARIEVLGNRPETVDRGTRNILNNNLDELMGAKKTTKDKKPKTAKVAKLKKGRAKAAPKIKVSLKLPKLSNPPRVKLASSKKKSFKAPIGRSSQKGIKLVA